MGVHISRAILSYVPRLRSHDSDDEKDVFAIDESRRTQRVVYRQLDRLTKLKCLLLGQSYNPHSRHEIEDVFQEDCLELSQESGLGALAGLKELRVLPSATRITASRRLNESGCALTGLWRGDSPGSS